MANTLEEQTREADAARMTQLAMFFNMLFFSTCGKTQNDPDSIIGRLGQTLYGDDHGEHWTVGKDGTRVRATGSGNFENPEAQKVFQALTNAANVAGVPRDLLFKFAWNAKDSPPMMGSGAQGENILNAVNYLKDTPWGNKLLASNPQLRELKIELDRVAGKYTDKDIFTAALKTDPNLARLQKLIKDPQLGAIVTAVNIRQVLVEKYKYNPESPEPLSPEVMRQAGGEVLLQHHFGKGLADEILANDDPKDTSAFFTEARLKAHPELKLSEEMKNKSAHQIVEWAQDKMSVDVSPLLQAAYAHPTAIVYNDIDAQICHGVSMAALKAAIRRNETGHMSQVDGYHIINSIGAVGAFQIMKFNIETKPGVLSWPEEALGVRMTVEQFRNSPAAQEAVGSYMYRKYADMSWRLHGGNATPEQIVKDVAAYWQSGTNYDNAVKHARTDGHWTTAQYGEEAWKAYQSMPREQIAMTQAEKGAPKAINAGELKLDVLAMNGADAPTEPKTATNADPRVPGGEPTNNAYALLTKHASEIAPKSPAPANTSDGHPNGDTTHPNYKVALATDTGSKSKDQPPKLSPANPIVAA